MTKTLMVMKNYDETVKTNQIPNCHSILDQSYSVLIITELNKALMTRC